MAGMTEKMKQVQINLRMADTHHIDVDGVNYLATMYQIQRLCSGITVELCKSSIAKQEEMVNGEAFKRICFDTGTGKFHVAK